MSNITRENQLGSLQLVSDSCVDPITIFQPPFYPKTSYIHQINPYYIHQSTLPYPEYCQQFYPQTNSYQQQQNAHCQQYKYSTDPYNFRSGSLCNFGFQCGPGIGSNEFPASFGTSAEKVRFGSIVVPTADASQFLLVLVHNMLYSITEIELHQVFDPYGYIKKIDILESSGSQAIIQFESSANAICAKNHLQGRNIYNECCQLDIHFSRIIGNENTSKDLLGEELVSFCNGGITTADLSFIKNEVHGMIGIIDKMQVQIDAVNSSMQNCINMMSKNITSLLHMKSFRRSSSSPTKSLSFVAPAPSSVVSLNNTIPKSELSLPAPPKLLERSPTKLVALAKIRYSTTLHTPSDMMLSTPKNFSPLQVFTSTKLYAPTQIIMLPDSQYMFNCWMLFRTQWFGSLKLFCVDNVSDIMSGTKKYTLLAVIFERNENKFVNMCVFVFDPGGWRDVSGDDNAFPLEELMPLIWKRDCEIFGAAVKSISHVGTSLAGSIELPSCPVCLEIMDQGISGFSTSTFDHSFRCSSIFEWANSSCSVSFLSKNSEACMLPEIVQGNSFYVFWSDLGDKVVFK